MSTEDTSSKISQNELLNTQVASNLNWLKRLAHYYKQRGHESKAEEILNVLNGQSHLQQNDDTFES
jgi:hypothetical protein